MAKSILVIDDDRLVINSIEKYLKTQGYNVQIARSGTQALEEIEKLNFDLIISDVRMPDMDGIETLRKIRERCIQLNKRKPPEVIITGYSEDQAYQQATELGIIDYLYKPFDLDRFIKIIEKNLEPIAMHRRAHPRVMTAFPRFPIELMIKDCIISPVSNIATEMLDLSEGGIGLISKDFLPITSQVTFSVNLPSCGISMEGEAQVVWCRQINRRRDFFCGMRFLDADIDSLKKIIREVNRQHMEKFFGISMPHYIREKDRDSYLFEKFDERQIMEVIDFKSPFLTIKKMAILGFDRQDILNIRGLGTGILTTNDTKGHYNDTIYLTKCGLLIGSAASIYLAILFPSTAPQVVEVDHIRLSKEGVLWKPSVKGSQFFVETRIVKKKLQMVVMNVRVFLDEVLIGEANKLKLVLAPKDHIWKAKELPPWKDKDLLEESIKKTQPEEIEKFFGTTPPEHIKKNYEGGQIYKRLSQEDIKEAVDFMPPFLIIDKMIIFDVNKDSISQSRSLSIGTITLKDTTGHYNDTIFLAMCGTLMASAVSIHLAVLFPGTAPEVIEAKGVKPIEKDIWKPAKDGSLFWVETALIKKESQLVTMRTRVSFDKMPYSLVDESTSILIKKELIWQTGKD